MQQITRNYVYADGIIGVALLQISP